MANYPESTKQSIGELVLQIRDLENHLVNLRNQGYALVAPLRVIADLFDSNQQTPYNILLATETHFATTHQTNRPGEQVIIGGNTHPAFQYPKNIKEILQETFETEQKLRQLEKLLHNATQRARKIPTPPGTPPTLPDSPKPPPPPN